MDTECPTVFHVKQCLRLRLVTDLDFTPSSGDLQNLVEGNSQGDDPRPKPPCGYAPAARKGEPAESRSKATLSASNLRQQPPSVIHLLTHHSRLYSLSSRSDEQPGHAVPSICCTPVFSA